MSVRHRIHIARTQYKFSCAHMTVFPDGTKERLHGHNYFVAVTLELATIDFAQLIPFQLVKARLGELCQEWKEHTLVPALNPFFELVRDDAAESAAGGSGDEQAGSHGEHPEYEFKLCGKRYVLPREDVLVLPIDNISVESLSAYFAERFLERLGPEITDRLCRVEVSLAEVPGQGAAVELDLEARRRGS